ncbi:SufE family protein [Zhengella sp. ZM62]|uniref:SufE family protein n=1 Tax=Zhengella sedimenti TaxID=3390035 RepID=UPI003976452C
MPDMSDTNSLPTIDSIREDFSFLDDWEERYRYVIDLGRELPPITDAEHNDANKVQGCVSQVWLVTDAGPGPDPVIGFRADSDAHIVRGLVAIMLALHSGKHASEILATDAEGTLRDLGLDEHLTPQRANGVRAMIARIRREAESRMNG